MIERESVDEVLNSVDIVELISGFVALKRNGVNYKGCCPFHNEKTASFVVSPSKGFYKCFGCGAGGNAVKFLMEYEKLSFVDAIKHIASKNNIVVKETRQSSEQIAQNDDRKSMLILNKYAMESFKNNLHTPEGDSLALSYFKHRKLDNATIEKFQLGYALKDRKSFVEKAVLDKYSAKFLESTGLVFVREDKTMVDRFAGRVVFPIADVSGNIVGFGGRILESDDKSAKYLNSPESIIYNKTNILYALDLAKKEITKRDMAILVEGYLDVISLHKIGIANTVASCGTALTQAQARLLYRFSHNITILYDGDKAGVKATFKAINILLEQGFNVFVSPLDENDDPDSLVNRLTVSEIEDRLENQRLSFFEYKKDYMERIIGTDTIKRADAISDIISSVSFIQDRIIRDLYINELSTSFSIDKKVLIDEVMGKIKKSSIGKEPSVTFNTREVYPKENKRNKESEESEGFTKISLENLKTYHYMILQNLEKDIIEFIFKFNEEIISLEGVEVNLVDFVREYYKESGFILEIEPYKTIFMEMMEYGVKNAIKRLNSSENDDVIALFVEMEFSEREPLSTIWEKRVVTVFKIGTVGYILVNAIVNHKIISLKAKKDRLIDSLKNRDLNDNIESSVNNGDEKSVDKGINTEEILLSIKKIDEELKELL